MLTSQWKNLSRCSTKLLHVCKKLPLALNCGQSKCSLEIFNIYIYIYYIIFNFGPGFCSSFPMLFPEATASCDKKFWNNFLLHCTFICMSSKSVNFFFQTGDINIFALLAIFFSKYVQLKSSFCQKKKHQWWNLRHSLVEKLSKFDVAKC